ncbi:tetratricopeptide repeat protein [Leucothrix mucor]|uniref:tetratricopeptide repeat protein n=1 Tax=Leucothrix mucor TaxID=45248 RepID=UPI00146B0E2B|nr:tetratricopeptide repeat protein [Leucothrix mucor]
MDILAGMAGSAKFFDAEKSNKSTKEKIGEGYKTISSGLVGALELGKDLIPGGALAAGTAKVLLGLGEGIAGKAAQISEDAAVAHPELYLLDALAAAGGRTNKPVLLVDTYEHILRNDFVIKSRLMLSYGNARENTEKEILLSSWLSSLFSYLEAKGWCIVVAGRDTASRTPDRLPSFNRAEMLKAAMSRPDLTQYLPQQEDAIATVLSILSFDGNPLWLQVAMNLLENLLAEGKDLEDLAQQPDYLQECFEEDDPFDTGVYDGIEFGRCKLSLIRTITHHIAGLEDQAWKIALPRVLDKGIVKQLFAPEQANAIIHNFKIAGVFRTTGAEFSLHEEIRDLLLAYARDKGWLESEDTRALHGKLWEYLNAFYIGKLPIELRSYISRENIERVSNEKDSKAAFARVISELTQHISLNWILDACYHRVMAQGSYHGVSADEFWNGLSGSISLDYLEKWRVSDALPTLSQYQVETLMQIWRDETDEFINLLPWTHQVDLDSCKAWRELSKKRRGGDLDLMLASIPFWIERVKKFPTPNNYYCLARAHRKSEKYTQAIELYDQVFSLFQASDSTPAAEVCANSLYDKGITLGNQLDNPQAEIDTYDQLIQRFGDADVPAIQELCAGVLYNKGWTLGNKLDNPQAAVDTYDKLIQRFGDADVPAIQELCADALYNKGWTLRNKLDNPQAAVDTYDKLIQRFGDADIPAIQERCAKALHNKGWTLGNKLDNPQAAADTYDKLIQRFGDADVPAIQELCAMALYDKGWTLRNKLDNPQAAVDTYDQLIQRFGDADIPAIQERCAMALVNKGWTLRNKLDNPQAAVDTYDQLIQRFDDTDVPAIQAQCAKALRNKGWTLGNQLDNPQAAVDTYDQLIQRFGDADVPAIQEQCAKALYSKGITLRNQLDNLQAEIDTYDQLIQRFGDADVPAIQAQCAMALVNKGVTLGRFDRIPEAMTCYEQLLDRYSNSELPAIQEPCLSAAANIVEPLLELGQTEAATQRIHQVMKKVDESNQKYAIMPYLLWLVEPEVSPASVITAIRKLSPDVEFSWLWGDIQSFIKELPDPRKTQAESFISFFETHQDLARLESELKATEN